MLVGGESESGWLDCCSTARADFSLIIWTFKKLVTNNYTSTSCYNIWINYYILITVLLFWRQSPNMISLSDTQWHKTLMIICNAHMVSMFSSVIQDETGKCGAWEYDGILTRNRRRRDYFRMRRHGQQARRRGAIAWIYYYILFANTRCG